jgi:hypothetical protein
MKRSRKEAGKEGGKRKERDTRCTIFGVTNTHCGSVPLTTSFAKSLKVRMRFTRCGSCEIAS